jgi:nucleoside-diphosphate-sugar epimerase
MKKVLVTGSLGYLGSVLTDDLHQSGHEVIGYDTGFFRNCCLYEPGPGKTVLKDARDLGDDELNGIDAVVHLAGISNDAFGNLDAAKVYDPTRAYSMRLARMCKERGIKFIFASSCSVYGKGQEKLLDEESATVPQTPYSLNKLQIEQDLQSISDPNFSPIALRFATAFGPSPRLRFDLVINMLTGMASTTGRIVLNSDGTPWRPNVHVLDICQAVRSALALDYQAGKLLVLNVGDENNNLQIIDIARKIQTQLPGCGLSFLKDNPEIDKEGLVQDRKVKGGVDTRTYKVSFEKIRKTLPGFRCHWSVDQGIQDLIARFRELGLTEGKFKDRKYYRLQTIEDLYGEHYLSDELRWLKARP